MVTEQEGRCRSHVGETFFGNEFVEDRTGGAITFNFSKDESNCRTDIVNSMQTSLQRCLDAITEFTAQNITKDPVQRIQNCDDSDDMKRNVTQADPATTTTT